MCQAASLEKQVALLKSQLADVRAARDTAAQDSARAVQTANAAAAAAKDHAEGLAAQLEDAQRKQRTEAAREIERLTRASAKSMDVALLTLELANSAYDLMNGREAADQRELLEVVVSNSYLTGDALEVEFRKPYSFLANRDDPPKKTTPSGGDSGGGCTEWSGRLDSNQRPPHPQYGALPGCATSRNQWRRPYRVRFCAWQAQFAGNSLPRSRIAANRPALPHDGAYQPLERAADISQLRIRQTHFSDRYSSR